MDNLRILAENIDQKNEIISMLVSIGYNIESTCSYNNDNLMGIHVYEDGDIQDVMMCDYCDKNHKEITIQQLRDMVVLKRNDVADATHTDQDGWKWYIGAKSYVWKAGNTDQLNQWDESSLDHVDLKPIEKKEMKEFLVNHDGKWTLQLLDADTEENSYRVAVPSGADVFAVARGSWLFYAKTGELVTPYKFIYKGDFRWSKTATNPYEIGGFVDRVLWQRSETEYLMHGETVKVTIDELKHRVYKKDVSHLDSIDVYRVLELFNVQSHAVGHAIKKLLCSGGRGAKDEAQDIQEAIDSLIRYQEMKSEDE